MTTRTDAEILARIKTIEKRGHDWLGTETAELVCRLSFQAAMPWRKLEAKAKDWKQWPRDAESVVAEMLDYMPFAWDKANNCRGISAGRSLNHMAAWLWLLGFDEAADAVNDYDHYGKPHLRAICEAFGWDWRQWDDGRWANSEDARGLAAPERVDPLPGLDTDAVPVHLRESAPATGGTATGAESENA